MAPYATRHPGRLRRERGFAASARRLWLPRAAPPGRLRRERGFATSARFRGISLRPVLAALAGGVGAARFLAGLVRAVPPREIVAIVNTADDDEFHGLYVSPDLDSVTYTLAGASNPAQGWGLEGETFATLDALARYDVRHVVPPRRQGPRDPPLPHRSGSGRGSALRGDDRDRRAPGDSRCGWSR